MGEKKYKFYHGRENLKNSIRSRLGDLSARQEMIMQNAGDNREKAI
jgi:hypothetical protein